MKTYKMTTDEQSTAIAYLNCYKSVETCCGFHVGESVIVKDKRWFVYDFDAYGSAVKAVLISQDFNLIATQVKVSKMAVII